MLEINGDWETLKEIAIVLGSFIAIIIAAVFLLFCEIGDVNE